VDGEPATLGQRVDPDTVRIEVDGVPLPVRPGLVYYLVNKPAGVISTADDPQGRPTVVGLVPDEPRVYPVGRLDTDSEGLLVLTNDGDLTLRLTHPRYGVTKEYTVLVEGSVGAAVARALTAGVDLEDGPARALACKVVAHKPGSTLLEVTMGEGRKREVRRMFDAVGHRVLRLVRTAVGPVRDRSLRPGEWRSLRADEVRSLYAAAADGPEAPRRG
jgi:23S rRNA pseudouridine2605 synthase